MKKAIVLFCFSFVYLALSAELKYIFFFIGDGMGTNHILLTEKYLSRMQGKDGRFPLCMSRFPYCGLVSTHSRYNDITDSSAAGTCLATGKKTTNGKIGIDEKNNKLKTIAERLHEMGWNVGIGTSVSIDHATPASFYAHQKSRKAYYNIGQQLAASGFEFFAGAPFLQPVPAQVEKDTIVMDTTENLYKLCTNRNYTFAYGYTDALTKLGKQKLILLPRNFNPEDSVLKIIYKLPYAIDKTKSDLTLAKITEIGIRKLSDKKFFFMVESGAIDWASHANDGKTVIEEMIEFDNAVKTAYKFYQAHKDETLIIVTSDHETGGLSLGLDNKYFLRLAYFQYQSCSSERLAERIKAVVTEQGKKCTWSHIRSLLTQSIGLFSFISVTEEEERALQRTFEVLKRNVSSNSDIMYSDADILTTEIIALINKKSYLGWSTTGHSGALVPIFSEGYGADAFTGMMDNSEIVPKLYELIGEEGE